MTGPDLAGSPADLAVGVVRGVLADDGRRVVVPTSVVIAGPHAEAPGQQAILELPADPEELLALADVLQQCAAVIATWCSTEPGGGPGGDAVAEAARAGWVRHAPGDERGGCEP